MTYDVYGQNIFLVLIQKNIDVIAIIGLLDQNSFDGLWKPTCLPVVSVSLTVR